MIDTDVLDTGLGDADDDDFDETVEVDDSQLPAHRYTDRELSWLAFNQRVLELAEDPALPVLERANFLAIFASKSCSSTRRRGGCPRLCTFATVSCPR